MKKYLFLYLLTASLICSSCFEDLDDVDQAATTSEINDFIYRGLNFFYLYKAETPELANDFFASEEEKNDFLSQYDSPEALFNYLKAPQDRFSFLTDNYIALENSLNGIFLTNGMEFGLVLYPDNSGNVFGYVRYVLPGTDAAANGVTRGMVFNTIDGQQLTENNLEALFAPMTYTIGLATIDGQTIAPTGESISLTKMQFTENPIHIHQTLMVEGEKIGYLMYNSFTPTFNDDLNAAFAQFRADGITDLVIDLRYNGGGSVATAKGMASMITGQFTGQLLFSEQWNADRQAEYAEDEFFENTLGTGGTINSLNLTQVYVLTTKSTASASELVINSLLPYIDVIQVGDFTAGKFQASFILYDAPAPGFNRSEANTGHTYAMLPLVFKTANAQGVTDYVEGLTPDILLREDYSNLGVLGDVNEPLLAAALNQIVPRTPLAPAPVSEFTEVSSSKASSPLFQIMVAKE